MLAGRSTRTRQGISATPTTTSGTSSSSPCTCASKSLSELCALRAFPFTSDSDSSNIRNCSARAHARGRYCDGIAMSTPTCMLVSTSSTTIAGVVGSAVATGVLPGCCCGDALPAASPRFGEAVEARRMKRGRQRCARAMLADADCRNVDRCGESASGWPAPVRFSERMRAETGCGRVDVYRFRGEEHARHAAKEIIM